MPLTAPPLDDLREREEFWRPIGESRASHCTRRLVEDGERIELRASRTDIAFDATFIGIGAVILLAGAAIPLGLTELDGGTLEAVGVLLLLLALGAIFGGFGWSQLRKALVPQVFDRRTGRYWHAHEDPGPGSRTKGRPSLALADVVALQLLERRARRYKGRPFQCLELNLVLRRGERVALVDHGRHAVLRAQAETLREFLRVPVLDGTAEAED
jgi:hypothetical protein